MDHSVVVSVSDYYASLLTQMNYYGRPLSVASAKSMLCFANVIYLFIFHGRLLLRPRLTEVRESFTRG